MTLRLMADEVTRPRVWLLEDSPLESELIRRDLCPSFDVEVFHDGAELLERLTNDSPDVLVLDWRLPGMSGLEVCQFVRSNCDAISLPIVILTVVGDKEQIVEGLAAGANDYVTKPFDRNELCARVTTLVRVRRLHRAVCMAERERAALLAREQQARREAEAANRIKDQFIATVSHELRTPLSAVLGWVRMLRTGKVPGERLPRVFETIERNAEAQAKLIEDLLDVSRMMAGKLRLEARPIDLAEVTAAAVESVRPTADARGVRLEVAAAAAAAADVGAVVGDANRLQQVVWNLLTNAIKFTPEGGLVRVDLERKDGFAELVVADTGRGIDPALLPHVFERFRQADDATVRANGGLGLGLAIVKQIAELHGGSVSAHSEGEGRGARFVVRIPLAQAARRDCAADERPQCQN